MRTINMLSFECWGANKIADREQPSNAQRTALELSCQLHNRLSSPKHYKFRINYEPMLSQTTQYKSMHYFQQQRTVRWDFHILAVHDS